MSRRSSNTTEAFKTAVDHRARALTIAATLGEMLVYLRETQPALANRIQDTRSSVLAPYYAASLERMLRS